MSKKVDLDEYGPKMVNMTMVALQELITENSIEIGPYLDERRGRYELAILLKVLETPPAA